MLSVKRRTYDANKMYLIEHATLKLLQESFKLQITKVVYATCLFSKISLFSLTTKNKMDFHLDFLSNNLLASAIFAF